MGSIASIHSKAVKGITACIINRLDKLNRMFTINLSDLFRAIVVAVLGGALIAIIGIIGSSGFDVFSADWAAIGKLAVNGAFGGFVGYLTKNFLTDSSGKVLGTF